jgi:hypothetical protein
MICGGGGEKAGEVIRLCVLLVLNVWCRVDGALLSAVLYGTFVWKERKALSAKILLISAALGLAGAAGFRSDQGARSPLELHAAAVAVLQGLRVRRSGPISLS